MLGDVFGNQERVAVRRGAGAHGDEAASLQDAVKRAAVHDKVFDDRERFGPPRLNADPVAVFLKFRM